MDQFATWRFLHVVAMFFGVALAISGELVLRRVAQSRDVRAIRVVVGRVKPLAGNGATILFLSGLVFGILAALAGQIDLLRPWLIGSYIAFGLAVVVGSTITDPWIARLERTASASPEETPSAELEAAITDQRARLATVLLMTLIVILVFLMVVKPLDSR